MQFFLYLIVGGLSFFVDIGSFIVLRAIEVPVILASVTSFILATAANYLLSVILAFERGRFRRNIEILRFLSVVMIGLGLNTLLVWCFVYPLALHPTVAKIIAVPIVLVWNYLGRRRLVFGNEIPAGVRAWLKSREADLTLIAAAKHGVLVTGTRPQSPRNKPAELRAAVSFAGGADTISKSIREPGIHTEYPA
jgi:putative flippase GtrA